MTMKRFLAPLLFSLSLIILGAGAGSALADQVLMNNGDRITGTVVKAEKGVLVLKTEYAEKLEVRLDAVAAIETEEPVEVRLEGGEVLTGALASEADKVKVLAGPERGETTVEWSRVHSLNVPPPPPWTWSGNLFLGANQQSGNTDRTSASFGGEATRRGSNDRFNLSLLYNYSEEDGEVTTRDTYGLIKYDYFFTEKFYGYLGVEMLKDKFKDLNLRTVVGPGVGYQLWDDDIKALAFEGGIAYFSEDRIDAADDHWFTGRLGLRFRYRLMDAVTFTNNLTVFPNLESGGDFTARNEAALVTAIAGPWALRLSNIWEHDSDPAEGVKKDDFKSGVNLQYSF